MGSDYSRRIFDKTKNYSGALLQQGRVILDSDWNEQWDLSQHRLKTESIDVIGSEGVPIDGDSFKVALSGGQLTFESGRMYLNGLLCENHSSTPINYLEQDNYPNPEFLNDGNLDLVNGKHLVYLKAWQRELNYLEDPNIQEKALGEADTTVRVQTVWQVRILKIEDDYSCGNESALYDDEIKQVDGKIEVRTRAALATEQSCMYQSSDGYRRLENQLYRVEIHNTGDESQIKFKWSRDNGTVETIVNSVSASELNVSSLGKDEYLNFNVDQWVELLDREKILNNEPGLLYQITSIDQGLNKITCNSIIDVSDLDTSTLILKRWDNFSGLIDVQANTWQDIEGGIQVKFSPGQYQSGDYWNVPARTVTESIDWPYSEPVLPFGIKYAYGKLAVLTVVENSITEVVDCRMKFPSLTDLYDLYKNRDGCCTIHVMPEPNWSDKLSQKLALVQDAKICFSTGTYELEKPLEIVKKGNLIISGCGPGSKIIAKNHEAALVFSACKSVQVRDLYIESSLQGDDANLKHLNGALTVLSCQQLDVSNTVFKTGIGSELASTCITARNENHLSPVRVRIQNNEMYVGHLQQGILLVNAIKVFIENNNISSYANSVRVPYNVLIEKDPKLKKDIATWLIGTPDLKSIVGLNTLSATESKESNPAKEKTLANLAKKRSASKEISDIPESIEVKKINSNFEKDREKIFFDVKPEKEIKTKNDLDKYKGEVLEHMLIPENRLLYPTYNAAINYLTNLSVDVGGVGITIGGKVSEDVRIFNNNIKNFLQGVHVGLSHENETKEPYIADKIDISNNSITNLIPPYINSFERYGIYVGNSYNLNISNNNLLLNRVYDYNKNTPKSNQVRIEGIRVWGELGIRMKISDNTISGIQDKTSKPLKFSPFSSYDIAILVNSIQEEKSPFYQWRIHDNVAVVKKGKNIYINPNTIKLNDDGEVVKGNGGVEIVNDNIN